MAKITITLEDVGSNVKVEMTPQAGDLFAKIMQQGHEALTPAESYAAFIVNQVRSQSKAIGEKMPISIPRIRRKP